MHRKLLMNSLNHFDQETSLRGSNFIFESVQLMHYKFHKANFRRDGSFIYSPGMIKKITVNLKNTDDKCFQYASTVALNYENTK